MKLDPSKRDAALPAITKDVGSERCRAAAGRGLRNEFEVNELTPDGEAKTKINWSNGVAAHWPHLSTVDADEDDHRQS